MRLACLSFFSTGSCKCSICGHESRQHRCDELGWVNGLAGFSTKHVGVGDQVPVDLGRELDRKLHRLIIWNGFELQLGHLVSPQL